MKRHLQELIAGALAQMRSEGLLQAAIPHPIPVERARDNRFGDFACNIAMPLAKEAKRKPRDLAEQIIARLPASPKVTRIEIAGPGFINFYMAADAVRGVVGDVLEAGEAFGKSTIGNGQYVQVEFVSANPTGPLHVGHGRGAAYGATVADLLAAAGFRVHREYYINDAGRQMDILAASIWLRYLELGGEEITFPSNGYKSDDYVWDIAASLRNLHADLFHVPAAAVFTGLPADEPQGGDKEEHIDAIVARAKELLGP